MQVANTVKFDFFKAISYARIALKYAEVEEKEKSSQLFILAFRTTEAIRDPSYKKWALGYITRLQEKSKTW